MSRREPMNLVARASVTAPVPALLATVWECPRCDLVVWDAGVMPRCPRCGFWDTAS